MGQKFVKTVQDKNHETGLDEWKAMFVREDLVKAFAAVSAKQGLKGMGGVVLLNHKQIEDRVKTLREKGGNEDTIEQLEHGRVAIEARLAQQQPKSQTKVQAGMRT
jgi:hypothetical protein